MRYFALLAILSACVIGCNDDLTLRLPPVGGVIYCPQADCPGNGGLYQRVAGTSRTAFKRSDYTQMRFDMPVPKPGEEQVCPFGPHSITTMRDGMAYTHYREVAQ